MSSVRDDGRHPGAGGGDNWAKPSARPLPRWCPESRLPGSGSPLARAERISHAITERYRARLGLRLTADEWGDLHGYVCSVLLPVLAPDAGGPASLRAEALAWLAGLATAAAVAVVGRLLFWGW